MTKSRAQFASQRVEHLCGAVTAQDQPPAIWTKDGATQTPFSQKNRRRAWLAGLQVAHQNRFVDKTRRKDPGAVGCKRDRTKSKRKVLRKILRVVKFACQAAARRVHHPKGRVFADDK